MQNDKHAAMNTLEDSNNQAYVTYKGAGFGVAKDMLIAL
jgi:hypothetical protein